MARSSLFVIFPHAPRFMTADREAITAMATTVGKAIDAESGVGKFSRLEEWLGDLDSNQGFPSQSRKFYR
jgi:hypothetical protein